MPKINQEEYEVLKELKRKGYNLIARAKEGKLIKFQAYHGKSEYKWMVTTNKKDSKFGSLYNSSKLFKFIQWEDEEPYSIAELIEEYEGYKGSWQHAIDLRRESEETEVKDIKEQISDKFNEYRKEVERQRLSGNCPNSETRGKNIAINYIEQFINQLDEPEYNHATAETILANAVDKGELSYYGDKYAVVEIPTIPQFVADWIEDYKENNNELGHAIVDAEPMIEIGDWIPENNDTFARAWLAYPNVEIEEEQKYYVRENNYLLCKWINEVIDYVEAVERGITDLVELKLTEQEIKDYDERYFQFAVKVEEMEK